MGNEQQDCKLQSTRNTWELYLYMYLYICFYYVYRGCARKRRSLISAKSSNFLENMDHCVGTSGSVNYYCYDDGDGDGDGDGDDDDDDMQVLFSWTPHLLEGLSLQQSAAHHSNKIHNHQLRFMVCQGTGMKQSFRQDMPTVPFPSMPYSSFITFRLS